MLRLRRWRQLRRCPRASLETVTSALPTVDPQVAGALWLNSGALAVSLGTGAASPLFGAPLFASPMATLGNLGLSNPLALPHWRVARAKVESQIANARVVMVGDSTFFGANAAGTVFSQNLSYWLAYLLNDPTRNFYVNQNSFVGFSTVASPGNRLGGDPQGRITAGSWGLAPVPTLGGAIAMANAAGAPLVFSPGAAIDTFNVFFNLYPAAGPSDASASLTATGGTPIEANEQGANSLGTATATAASVSASNTLTVNWNGTGGGGASQFNIEGIEAFNSQQKSVNIFNAGWYGATSSMMAGYGLTATVYNPLQMLEYLAPALTIIEADINDWTFGTVPVSQHSANLQALIAAGQLSGDVIVVTGTPNDFNTSLQAQIVAASKQVAASMGCLVVDLNGRFGTWDAANALGLMLDSKHPNALGYFDQAQAIANILRAP